MENPPIPPLDSLFPVLRDFAPRPPRREVLPGLQWKAIFRGPTAFLLPMLLIFTLFPIFILAATRAQQSAQQRVSGRAIQVERLGQGQIFVKYRFTNDGQIFTGSGLAVGNSPLRDLRQGDDLPIQFNKTDPRQNAPLSNQMEADEIWPLFLFFPFLALFFFGSMLAPQLRALFLARRLLARGHLATGQVKFIKTNALPSPFSLAGTSQIFYAWTDESGVARNGAVRCDNPWLVNQFHVDSPVVVAYDAQKPARSVLLEPFVA